jgi:ring-1,2-phenylacetyl-CoA epoxidase subunit PaaC
MQTESEVIFESTDEMTAPCRSGLEHLVTALADTKLLMGYHFGEWTFGTPELEAAVASCSLAQSELGHVRLLQAILKRHYHLDPEQLVETRKASEFANVASLDRPVQRWTGLVAMNFIVDLAVTRVLNALRGSAFKPLRMSVDKMIDEERYHIHHGQGWFRTLAARTDGTRETLLERVHEALEAVAVWLGPADDAEDHALIDAGIKTHSNADIWSAFMDDVGRAAGAAGVQIAVTPPVSFTGWNPATRRLAPGGPDEEILYHLRGSKNEIFKRS